MKRIITFGFMFLMIIGATLLISSKNDKSLSLTQEFTGKTIDIKGSDNIIVKADLYESEGKNDPVILLFHQAGYSRGEYRPIAPKLVELGFTCISIDQRSGNKVNGIVNETRKEASEKGLGTKYPDAYPDLEAALKYARAKYPSRKVIIWGSSYSSSLVLIMATEYSESISGVVSFSPGEYFKFRDKEIKDYAKDIECPVFISSARNEGKAWKEIFEQIPGSGKRSYLPETKGIHGSRALWETTEGNEGYWEALMGFLNQFK